MGYGRKHTSDRPGLLTEALTNLHECKLVHITRQRWSRSAFDFSFVPFSVRDEYYCSHFSNKVGSTSNAYNLDYEDRGGAVLRDVHGNGTYELIAVILSSVKKTSYHDGSEWVSYSNMYVPLYRDSAWIQQYVA